MGFPPRSVLEKADLCTVVAQTQADIACNVTKKKDLVIRKAL